MSLLHVLQSMLESASSQVIAHCLVDGASITSTHRDVGSFKMPRDRTAVNKLGCYAINFFNCVLLTTYCRINVGFKYGLTLDNKWFWCLTLHHAIFKIDDCE